MFAHLFAEVESRTQSSRPRTQKKSEAKHSPSEDRSSRGHGQECSKPTPRTMDTGASILQKKVFVNFFQAISKIGKQKRFSQIFREVSGVFLHNFKTEQIPTIVGTDANAHRTIWGPSDINLRGEDLLAYCVSGYPYTSQKNISLNVLFPELTFVRNDTCQNEHLPEITSARMNTCLKLHLPE